MAVSLDKLARNRTGGPVNEGPAVGIAGRAADHSAHVAAKGDVCDGSEPGSARAAL